MFGKDAVPLFATITRTKMHAVFARVCPRIVIWRELSFANDGGSSSHPFFGRTTHFHPVKSRKPVFGIGDLPEFCGRRPVFVFSMLLHTECGGEGSGWTGSVFLLPSASGEFACRLLDIASPPPGASRQCTAASFYTVGILQHAPVRPCMAHCDARFLEPRTALCRILRAEHPSNIQDGKLSRRGGEAPVRLDT